jgi:hypothetical protein
MTGLTPKNQDATWRKNIGGYPVNYADSDIQCRYVPKQKTILQANGTLKLSSAIVRCAEAVSANDRIIYGGKDSLVLAVNPIIGLGGEILEYEVIL